MMESTILALGSFKMSFHTWLSNFFSTSTFFISLLPPLFRDGESKPRSSRMTLRESNNTNACHESAGVSSLVVNQAHLRIFKLPLGFLCFSLQLFINLHHLPATAG